MVYNDTERYNNDGQVANSSTDLLHAQRGIFFPMRRLGRGSVRGVCSRLLCQSIAIDARFLCGFRLIID